jgi:hypothetical protein
MTKTRKLPAINKLNEYVSVCPSSPSGLAYVKSKRAAVSISNGRYVVAVAGVYYTAARILFYLTQGIDLSAGDLIMHQGRPVTRSEAAHARKDNPAAVKTSAYRGVSWRDHGQAWVAKITHNRQIIVLGRFHSELLAAQAYDASARRLFGDLARLNFP